MTAPATLVLGWGNPGRRDDGLGPALAAAVAAARLPGVAVESDFQLQVEDSAALVGFERVLFVDADRQAPPPFWLRRLEPAVAGADFTTHRVPPGCVLSLGRELFGAAPEAWLLGIRGYEFDAFDERLSDRAAANLAAATGFVIEALRSGVLHEAPALA